MDAVENIRRFNEGRDPERLRIKYQMMRRDTLAFLRGTCHLFYDQLPRGSGLKTAPATWICGDLHLENFGSYKGDNRLVYFDINDFDEAVLAPASWDLVRALASVWVGAECLALGRSDAASLCDAFLDSYAASLMQGKAYWVERDTAQGQIRALLDGLRGRQRRRFVEARTRIKGSRRVLCTDGERALPASAAQHALVAEFMEGFASTQPDPTFYRLLDAARRIAGTGSLGVDRYVVLVQGKGTPDGNYLLELKRALPSSLAPHLKCAQPPWPTQAHRIVALQRRLQAVSVALLHPVMIAGAPYVIRDLQPSQDRIALVRPGQTMSALAPLLVTMGQLVAWAQLRSSGRDGSAIADELIEFARGKKWKERLLGTSQACAEQVRRDAGLFNTAYDDGTFAN